MASSSPPSPPSSSSSSPTPTPTLEQRRAMTDSYGSFMHNTSLTMLFLAPVLMALPPRKLDLYTFSLGGAFVLSANQLTKERNHGSGIIGTLGGALVGRGGGRNASLPNRRADEEKKEKERKRLLDDVPGPLAAGSAAGAGENHTATTASDSRPPSKLEAAAKELWMGSGDGGGGGGGETDGWKERRLKEEQDKLDQGEGYGGMIMDQIWEVWNWGKAKDDQLIAKDKQVLSERDKRRAAAAAATTATTTNITNSTSSTSSSSSSSSRLNEEWSPPPPSPPSPPTDLDKR